MNPSRLFALAIALVGLVASSAVAQMVDTVPQSGPKLVTAGRSSVRVIPGEQYEAGFLHRIFYGGLWRDLWSTPIDVPVLDLERFAGGLKPTKRGGGFQTKSLRFSSPSGREFKFRSIDKDPAKVLPEDLQETFVADIVQDLIATSNPVSALVAVPIINAAGVLNAEPILIVLPDDPRLGQFQTDFGGVLGTLEENPSDEADEGGFGGADKIILTEKLYNRLTKDNDEHVDARAFLTARLTDVFLGDWDRHLDQWKWARYEQGKEKLWRPIARDRDQAFARYNGIVPDLAEVYVPQIEGATGRYPDMKYLTWSGRHIDRRYLSSLDRPTWDSVTAALVARLDDSVIYRAVQRMPPPMYAKEGKALEEMLISRRDRLHTASMEYYEHLADVVDIYGSDKRELAEINRRDDDHVEVTIHDLDKEGRSKGDPLFHRVFDRDTREIRVYMLGGNDSVMVKGHTSSSILARVIGGDGDDIMIDRSEVDGFLSAETQTYFYDSDPGGSITEGPSSTIDRSKAKEAKNDQERFEPLLNDRGSEDVYFPWINYNSDLGVFVGGHATFTYYGFRADPYRMRADLRLGFATTPRQFKGEFRIDNREIIPGIRTEILVGYSGLEVLNYYGLGNESARDKEAEKNDFYRVEQKQSRFRLLFGIPLLDGVEWSINGEAKRIQTSLDDSTFLSLDTTGIPEGAVSIGTGLTIDTRRSTLKAQNGFYIDLRGSYFPKVIVREAFTRLSGDIRAYLSARIGTEVTLALRAAGEKLWGEFPYFESAYIGGSGTLRGFSSQRFAGDASLVGNAELRVHLGKVKLIFPGQLGIFGLADAGRVFLDGESSTKLHTGFGGGLWFSVIEPANTITVAAAQSDEKLGIYVVAGFGF